MLTLYPRRGATLQLGRACCEVSRATWHLPCGDVAAVRSASDTKCLLDCKATRCISSRRTGGTTGNVTGNTEPVMPPMEHAQPLRPGQRCASACPFAMVRFLHRFMCCIAERIGKEPSALLKVEGGGGHGRGSTPRRCGLRGGARSALCAHPTGERCDQTRQSGVGCLGNQTRRRRARQSVLRAWQCGRPWRCPTASQSGPWKLLRHDLIGG